MGFLETEFAGAMVRAWLIAAGVAAGSFLVLRVVQAILVGRFAALARRIEKPWTEILVAALRKTKALFLVLVALWAAAEFVLPQERLAGVLTTLAGLGLILQAGIWANAAINAWLESYRRRKLAEDAAAVTTMTAAGFLAKLIVWSLVLLFGLDSLGVQITALVAGLGVGGIAVALAVQNILGDLFASLSIVLDKPFVVGDFLIIDSFLGSVEHVGLKTTRIRSLSGEQLVFSNTDLLGSRIRNYGRMQERRVAFTLGVTYQTPREKLERIPGMIRAAIEAQADTRFDRSHFKEYGAFSLDFETVYFIMGPDYNKYMDIQQAINLAVHAAFEDAGVEFAYPTQTLFLERGGAEPGAPA